MSAPVCCRCSFPIRGRDPLYLPSDTSSYCARCFPQSRHRSAALTARCCGHCGRVIYLPDGARVRHCCGSCRSSAFGLGTAKR